MGQYMQLALDEAKAARTAGDFPYGAVLVRRGVVLAASAFPCLL
jgi:tRNA(Arg) A34 adenosine deaminase TadA